MKGQFEASGLRQWPEGYVNSGHIGFWRRPDAALGRTVMLSNSVRIGKQSCPYSTEVHCIAAADGHEKSLWKKGRGARPSGNAGSAGQS